VPRLIVYAGPNGAGKSTLREAGDDQIDVVIDPDRIAKGLEGAAPEIEAGRLALTLFKTSLAEGKSVSLETTLSGHTVLQRMLAARRIGYDVELRFVALASPIIHIDRIDQRVLKGGHYIPPETVIRRYAQSLENLPKAISLAHRAVVIDNSDVEKRLILKTEGGLMLQLAPNPPAWFAALLPAIRAVLGAP
jgi:predicted ABC-type ATPase